MDGRPPIKEKPGNAMNVAGLSCDGCGLVPIREASSDDLARQGPSYLGA